MKTFVNERPIVIFGSLLILGIVLGNEFIFNYALYIYAAVLVAVAFILSITKHLNKRILYYCIGFTLGLILITFSKGQILNAKQNFYVGTTKCTIYVVSADKDDTSIKVIADDVTVGEKKYEGKVYLSIYNNPSFEIKPGQTIELTAKFSKPKSLTNPYGFDYDFYLQQKGISISASADASTCVLINEKQIGVLGVTKFFREEIENKIDSLYGDNAGLVKGILLGDKTEINDEVLSTFRNSGLAHVLAVSGLHISFIVAFLLYLLRLLKLKEKKIIILIAGILVVYCAVTDFSPSIVRASIMAIFVLGSKVAGKRLDTLTSLFAAAIVILLFDPFALFSASFQLSFSAVLGILFLYDRLIRLFKCIPNKIRETLAVSISAQCGIFLVSAYYFYNVTLYSVFANILAIPILGILVIFAFVSVIFGFILNVFAAPFVFVVNIVLKVLTFITTFVSSLPFSSVIIGKPPIYIILLFFLLLFIISKYVIMPKFNKIAGSLIVIVILLLTAIISQLTAFKGLEIIVFDVGQGDSTYIKTPGGYDILIDGGPLTETYDAGESVLLRYFYGSANTNIDLLIASHSHSDHVGGFVSLVNGVDIQNYIEPNNIKAADNDIAYKALKQIIKSKEIKSTALSSGNTIELDDGVSFEILYPDGEEDTDENERALVIKLTYNDFSMLFTADINSEIESKIAQQVGSINVLKVAHHGSKYSSSSEFLKTASPQTSIISVGANSYGHPTKEVLERLSASGSNIYRTDEHGAVIIKVYENNYTVNTMLSN